MKLKTISSIIFVLFTFFSVSAQKKDYQITVLFSKTNIQESPNFQSQVVWTCSKGDKYYIRGEDSGDWWLVEREEKETKITGWIRKSDVIIKEATFDDVFEEIGKMFETQTKKKTPEWISIIQSGSYIWEYQTKSYQRNGTNVRAWVKDINPQTKTKLMYLAEFNCASRQTRWLSFAKYINNQITEREDAPNAKFSFVIPETDNELLMNRLCKVEPRVVKKKKEVKK